MDTRTECGDARSSLIRGHPILTTADDGGTDGGVDGGTGCPRWTEGLKDGEVGGTVGSPTSYESKELKAAD